jgi:hypothetical protein
MTLAVAQEQTPPTSKPDAVFREPFTLRLHVDKEHYYEERYDKRIPYVAESDVYLFSGENFGVNVSLKADEIVDVTYEPNAKKADVWFNFTQSKQLGGVAMMLVIQNKLKRRLYIDAIMTVPGKKGIYKTSIVPIDGGLSDYESWPHPIVQLVLRNLRFSEKQGKSQQ